MNSCITCSGLTLNSTYCLVVTSTGRENKGSSDSGNVFTTSKKIEHHLHRDMGFRASLNPRATGTDLVSCHSERLINFDEPLRKMTNGVAPLIWFVYGPQTVDSIKAAYR